MATCLVGLGANLGDVTAQLDAAVEQLRRHAEMEVRAVSSYVNSRPAGGPPGQQDFLNAVVQLTTPLAAHALLGELQRIEQALGRRRELHWGPRHIDLDLLLYGDVVIDSAGLQVPHPRMAFRRFVMEPACQIAADMVHPRIGWTLADIAEHLNTAPDYLAVSGIPGTGKTALARTLAERTGATCLLDVADGPEPQPGTSAPDRERGRMRRRQQILEAMRTREGMANSDQTARFFVSDFWFEQAAAYVTCGGEEELQVALLGELRSLSGETPRPKLLIVLVAAQPMADLERLQQLLLERSRRPGIGPTLWLDAGNPGLAADEVVAAMAAMI